MTHIVTTSMYEIMFDDGISLSFEEGWVFDLERLLVLITLIASHDLLGYDTIVHYHIVELAWIDILLYRTDEVYHFHIGSLSSLGHRIAYIDELGVCITESFAHADTEEIGHDGREEISRPDDDIVCFEDCVLGVGIQISRFSYEPCIDDVLIEIVRACEVIFI